VIAGGAALLVAGSALAACSGASSATSSTVTTLSPSYSRAHPTSHGASGAAANEIGDRAAPAAPLIVRTGSLALKLIHGSMTRVFDLMSEQATALNGFVASSATTGTTSASLVLRVPSSDFSKLVDEITSDGHTVHEQLNGQDVTGESINLQARITNLGDEEAALRALLGRAGSIASILDVQDQLFTVEGEIEQLTAQESSLADQATYATLTVALSTSAPPVHRPAHPNAVSRAVALAARNTVAVGRGLVLLVGWAFPAAVVAIIAGGVLWARRRRRISGAGRRTDSDPSPAAP
jgi:hypothetical protein